ncbi:MAG: hypothetical protein P4L93_01370 [Coriobacteriia bacterium]|nr:hypothetical protein [Coriobacteriia bacterium]
MNLRRALGLLAVIAVLVLAGCLRPQAQSSPQGKLLGTWFDSQSGDEYKFITDSVLVVPRAQPGGGNAVTYRIVDGDKLDIESSGSHHVSVIESVTPDRLTLADPISGAPQYFYRSIAKTRFIKSVEATALAAVSQFGTITPNPEIVWLARKPTGKGTEWVDWMPTTLNTYGTAWDWSSLKRDKTLARTWGGGSAMGYSFSFVRPVPSNKSLEGLKKDTSIDATAGFPIIDVGYSASKAKYPAGTMVYLPGGMIYSLGDGYAIGVALDRKNQSFVPLTHK